MNVGRAPLIAAAAVAVCGGGIWVVAIQHSRSMDASPAGILRRLPVQDAMVLFVDFGALRRTGALDLLSRPAAEEPDYREFVRATGFDYRADLDLAAASFGADGEFFVVKGTFDWSKLQNYARSQGGSCDNRICKMPGSTPERKISFARLQSNLLALAVSQDSSAALRLTGAEGGGVQPVAMSRDPVWLTIPAGSVHAPERLPSGTRLFASALASADKILLSFGPQGSQFEARLAVTCRSPSDAASLAARLQQATSVVREAIARENQKPDARDLTGVLTAGVFEYSGRNVVGRWPLRQAFLESLASGNL